MFSIDQINLTKKIAILSEELNVMISTAESCTGGLVGSCLTNISGSSKYFERGFITYNNASKIELLEVKKTLIDSKGAVSPEVAKAMAEGVLFKSNSSLSLSCTGIAGPTGGTKDKPVGLVYIASSMKNYKTVIKKYIYDKNDRNFIRKYTLNDSLKMILSQLIFLKNNKI